MLPAPRPTSELAYPDTLPPEQMKKEDVRSSTGYIFHLPNGDAIPDDTRTDKDHGEKFHSPTGLMMTPYPDRASEVAAAGRRTGETLNELKGAQATEDAPSNAGYYFYLATKLDSELGHYGTYDFQRERKNGRSLQHPQFQAISNFNVGLFCQQAGLSLDDTLDMAGKFASQRSMNADSTQAHNLNKDTRDFIERGWQAGQSGVYGIGTVLQ